jgi:hypothetical protein
MIRNEAERKGEILDLQKHIEHKKSIGHNVDSEEMQERNLIETLKYLKCDFKEMKVWTKYNLKVGDIIELPHMKRSFIINQIISCEDHTGRFTKIESSKNSFYTLVGTIYA